MRVVLSDYIILVHLLNKQNIFVENFTILELKLYTTLHLTQCPLFVFIMEIFYVSIFCQHQL